jgi:parallel beta-helix repeat protein
LGKVLCIVISALLAIGFLFMTSRLEFAKAETGAIYIRADGAVDPSSAPIQRVGDIYTFIGNISNSSLHVQRSAIIDGAGYAVQGVVGDYGINVTANNVTIRNVVIQSCAGGIYLDSDYNRIYGNIIKNNVGFGIWLRWYAAYNDITENYIANNEGGVGADYVSHNSIFGNNIANNTDHGLYLDDFWEGNISGNNITDNGIGIRIQWTGKNITISGNNITHNAKNGISIEGSANVTISSNRIVGNGYNYTWYGEAYSIYDWDDRWSENLSVTYNFIAHNRQGNIIDVFQPSNTTYRVANISLDLSTFRLPAWIGYSLDSRTNVTVTGDTELIGLSNGSHTLLAYATDISGNSGVSDSVSFMVSLPPSPTLSLTPSPSPIIPEMSPLLVAATFVIIAFLLAVTIKNKPKRTWLELS